MNESTSTMTDNFINIVKVDWKNDYSPMWWNETCALVLEVFGLPGKRYIYKPQMDYMEFMFVSERDKRLCEILLSERL